MGFAFCWEYQGCTRECRVRDVQVLFCWRAAIADGRKTLQQCQVCAYRQAWVRGELATADFVKRGERRAQARLERRVLVVDDEPNILFALEETVRNLGFGCIAAGDGDDALVIARGALPDLIITDVIMPGLNGFELCEKLKAGETTRGIPVVMVTVRANERDRSRGASSGADAYLAKPFHPSDLKEIIHKFLPQPAP